MNIDRFKKSIKLALKESFSNIKYGDNSRTPYAYIATCTQKGPFRGKLPKDTPLHRKDSSTEFPKLSKELLISLFSYIGVEYLPEICLYQLQKREPIEIFSDFVTTFGISIEDRLEQRAIIDAKILNRVILYLRQMDNFRQIRLFDSRAIYKLLAQQKFEKADKMIDKLKEG